MVTLLNLRASIFTFVKNHISDNLPLDRGVCGLDDFCVGCRRALIVLIGALYRICLSPFSVGTRCLIARAYLFGGISIENCGGVTMRSCPLSKCIVWL